MSAASIKKVIFNPPATIVFWSDGTKTVVKCHVNDIFDPEKGLAMAVAKRCANNSPEFYPEMRKWIDKSGYKPADKQDEFVYHVEKSQDLLVSLWRDAVERAFNN